MIEAYSSITKTVGNTPLVRLQNSLDDIQSEVFAKLEYFNPGLSVKDRVGLHVIEEAERSGKLSPGGTIIECTSGNTGIGLAICAAAKSYTAICILTNKHSQEKIQVLKSLGAKIIICDASLPKDHPDSPPSTAARLHNEIKNSIWVNQYENPLNPDAHFNSTGAEIWEQTKGKITHFISSGTTGGTISGVGKYLKAKNPNIKIWAADSYGSAFKAYHETGEVIESEIYANKSENVGKNYIPGTFNFDIVDHFEKVADKNSALMARNIAKKEGMLLGFSCGAAFSVLHQMANKLSESDVVVVLCPDHGSRYMSTIYNDEWMEENEFLESNNLISNLNGSI